MAKVKRSLDKCHQVGKWFDFLSNHPHPRTHTQPNQKRKPERGAEAQQHLPDMLDPCEPGERKVEPHLGGRAGGPQAAQPPVLHLDWPPGSPLGLWKQDGRVPGRRLQGHSRPAVQSASGNLQRKQDLGAGMCGRDGQRDKLTRDERTMTCMQSVFFCFSPFPQPFILVPRPITPARRLLFRAGPRRSGPSPLARPMDLLPHQRRHARRVWAAAGRPLVARKRSCWLTFDVMSLRSWTHNSSSSISQQPTPACFSQA